MNKMNKTKEHSNAILFIQFKGFKESSDVQHCNSSVPIAYLEAIAASVTPRHLEEALHALLVDLPIRGAQVKSARMAAPSTKASGRVLPLIHRKRRHDGHVRKWHFTKRTGLNFNFNNLYEK